MEKTTKRNAVFQACIKRDGLSKVISIIDYNYSRNSWLLRGRRGFVEITIVCCDFNKTTK